MKIKKRLQASSFSFITLNLVEKAVLHIIMADYVKSAIGNKLQITFPVDTLFTFNLRPVSRGSNTENLLRKIMETLKRSIFGFTIANLVNKGILYFLPYLLLILVTYGLNFSFKM